MLDSIYAYILFISFNNKHFEVHVSKPPRIPVLPGVGGVVVDYAGHSRCPDRSTCITRRQVEWILVNAPSELFISVISPEFSVNYRWHLVNCLWVLENYQWILVMSLWILSILVNSLSYRWMPVNALWILHEFSQNSRKILIEVSMCCSVNLTEFSRQYQGMLADWSVSAVHY